MMQPLGKPLTDRRKEETRANVAQIQSVERDVAEAVQAVRNAGTPVEVVEKGVRLSVWEKIEYLVDPGSWFPLHTLYHPRSNQEETTGVIDGLGRINGRWAVVVGLENTVTAGTRIAEDVGHHLRVRGMAKTLRVPLVWIVDFRNAVPTARQAVYAERRGNGITLLRHAELEEPGVPVLAGIFGTGAPGSSCQGISPTILLGHKDAAISLEGAGAASRISAQGSFGETGFFREVYDTEEHVLAALKKYVSMIPAYDPHFFRVAEPKEPRFSEVEVNHIVAFDQKKSYDLDEVLARVFDNSEHMEFRPDYGLGVYTGLAKIDGLLVGFIGDRQASSGKGDRESGSYPGIGGNLCRQELIKMNEFVTLCGRDRLPLAWFQDTTGIHVKDIAEKLELLGLGQSLIHSVERADVPMISILLRKGTPAAHDIMGGEKTSNTHVFTLGTPTTEIHVTHGDPAPALPSERPHREKDAGQRIEPIVDRTDTPAAHSHERYGPIECANRGFVDEIIPLPDLRRYIVAFAGCCYQNPKSICAHHRMVLPKIIQG